MSNELSSSIWSGKCLVSLDRVGPIPKGALVYCFLDYGDWFRVFTREPYLGVHEFKLAPIHREKFSLLA